MPRIARARVHEDGFAWVDRDGRRTSEMPATLLGGEGIVAECAGIRPESDRTAKAMLTFRAGGDDPRGVDEQKQRLAEAFAGMGWRVPQILDAMGDAPDFYFDIVCQVHMPAWSAGRVALLGDAAFCASPLSGLGTSMAIVGAYVLAGELAESMPDHRSAFAAYEEQMRPYVRQCQKLPPGGVNGMLPKSQLAITIRDLTTRIMTRRPFSRLLAVQADKADAITLKTYRSRAGSAVTTPRPPVGSHAARSSAYPNDPGR